jgi:ribosomal protein L37AE/L43A
MEKIIELSKYEKKVCSICGEEHLTMEILDFNVCPKCNKEFSRYRNIINNMLRVEPKKAIKKEHVPAYSIVK